MNNHELFIEEMKSIHADVLEFLDSASNTDDDFSNLQETFYKIKIPKDIHKLKVFLHLILTLSNNHHREPDFFSKIKRILNFFKGDITKSYTNSEIFNIFKSNKVLLLYVIKEKMLKIDNYVIAEITSQKFRKLNYPEFFEPEIESFRSQKQETVPDDFDKKRENGENEDIICEMIRNDDIDHFIEYFTKKTLPFKISIPKSVFESNLYLCKNTPKLIEYAAFFGSIKIFKYLLLQNIQLTDDIGQYVIYGNNAEIFQIIEENLNLSDFYKELYITSLKCHHHNLTNYIMNQFDENQLDTLVNSYKYYNFDFIDINYKKQYQFFYASKYDYYHVVDYLIDDETININTKIEKIFFSFLI